MGKKNKGSMAKRESDIADSIAKEKGRQSLKVKLETTSSRKRSKVLKRNAKKRAKKRKNAENEELFSLSKISGVSEISNANFSGPEEVTKIIRPDRNRVSHENEDPSEDEDVDVSYDVDSKMISCDSEIPSDCGGLDESSETDEGDVDKMVANDGRGTLSAGSTTPSKARARFIPSDTDEAQGLLIMEPNGEVVIQGQFCLHLIKGKMSILGYELPEGRDVPLFSSMATGALRLEDQSCEYSSPFPYSYHHPEFSKLFGSKCASLMKEVDASSSAAYIRKPPDSPILFAAKMKAFHNVFQAEPKVYLKGDEAQAIETDKWKKTANVVRQHLLDKEGKLNPVVLLCGNKNTGKSTLARFLLNSLRDSAITFFLECDVGQTEFTPPGVISICSLQKTDALLGPPFTHQRKPIKSYFFGNITPRDDPKTYISCIREAYTFYFTHCKDKGPLVINTQGWIKGMGLALLMDVIRIANPSLVLQLKTAVESAKNNFTLSREFVLSNPGWVHRKRKRDSDDVDSPEISNDSETPFEDNYSPDIERTRDNLCKTKFLIVPAYEGSSSHDMRLKAVDYRRLSILTYFGQMLMGKGGDSEPVFIPRPFESLSPRILYWKDVAVHCMHCKLPPGVVMLALNFSVVSLATVDPNRTKTFDLPEEGFYEGPKFIRENPVATHVGFGFVRNVDVGRKCFLILTPESEEDLRKVNVLLKGAVDMPRAAFNRVRIYVLAYWSYKQV